MKCWLSSLVKSWLLHRRMNASPSSPSSLSTPPWHCPAGASSAASLCSSSWPFSQLPLQLLLDCPHTLPISRHERYPFFLLRKILMSLFIQGLLLGKHLTLSVETTLFLRPSVSVADSERGLRGRRCDACQVFFL